MRDNESFELQILTIGTFELIVYFCSVHEVCFVFSYDLSTEYLLQLLPNEYGALSLMHANFNPKP